MKKKGIPYGLLAFATLWLLYDVYYWSMRSSAGVLRNIDVIICITSGLICVFVIFFIIFKKIRKRHKKN